jgi:hypothetical protein
MEQFSNIWQFDQWVIDSANKVCISADDVEMYNGTLFVTGCTAREAAKLQTVFEKSGVGVIVTPGTEYSFDFV